MKTYIVWVRLEMDGSVEIEADSPEEALKIANSLDSEDESIDWSKPSTVEAMEVDDD